MKRTKKIYVCVNRRFGADTPSCAMRGSEKTMEMIREELAKVGKNHPVEKIMCLGQCDKGPAIRIAPGGAFFLGAKKDKVPEIMDWIEEHMTEDEIL